MTRKGRFLIDSGMLGEEPLEDVPTSGTGAKLGPMASAIRETGQAITREKAETGFDQLHALRLAADMVKLHEAELDLRLVPLKAISVDHLARDRREMDQEALEELKTSIRSHGLSNPIRVDEAADGALLLVQGSRRLKAYADLLVETGDERFETIPALVSREGERELAYRRMVDENLIREDVSLAELASLASRYAEETGIEVGEAVERLFASADRNKRWTILQFTGILAALGGALHFPQAISRNLGRTVAKALEDTDGRVRILAALEAKPHRTQSEELKLLEDASSGKPKAGPRSASHAGKVRKFRVLGGSETGRRYDVSITDSRLVVSGKGIGQIDENVIRQAVERLLK